jgi:hypothetical protein
MRLAATLALAAGAAAAQTPPPGPVYAAFDAGVGGRGGVTFVFSDGARPEEFAPLAAYAVRPTETGCGLDFGASADIPERFRAQPVLNPLDPAGTVPPVALPMAMADLAVAELQRLELTSDPAALRAHVTCVRRLWERVVGLRR